MRVDSLNWRSLNIKMHGLGIWIFSLPADPSFDIFDDGLKHATSSIPVIVILAILSFALIAVFWLAFASLLSFEP